MDFFITCGKCSWYSRSLSRCVQGKINPKTIKGGLEAAELMGLDYICNLSKHKSKIAEQLCKAKLKVEL